MENISQHSNSPSTLPDNLLRVVNVISASSTYARSHGNNCQDLSEHSGLVLKTLDAMKGTFLIDLDVIKEEVLDKLEEALTRGAELAESCKVKSVFYMVATGWNVVYRFREVHEEIDRCMNSEALISLIHEFRMLVKTNVSVE